MKSAREIAESVAPLSLPASWSLYRRLTDWLTKYDAAYAKETGK